MKQSYTLDEYNSARSVVGDTIAELGGKDSRVWLLTPDIGFGCKEFHGGAGCGRRIGRPGV